MVSRKSPVAEISVSGLHQYGNVEKSHILQLVVYSPHDTFPLLWYLFGDFARVFLYCLNRHGIFRPEPCQVIHFDTHVRNSRNECVKLCGRECHIYFRPIAFIHDLPCLGSNIGSIWNGWSRGNRIAVTFTGQGFVDLSQRIHLFFVQSFDFLAYYLQGGKPSVQFVCRVLISIPLWYD